MRNGLLLTSAKKWCLRFAKFNCSEKLQNIFEIGLKKCGVKKCFERKNSQTRFLSALGPETDEQMKLAKNDIRVNL